MGRRVSQYLSIGSLLLHGAYSAPSHYLSLHATPAVRRALASLVNKDRPDTATTQLDSTTGMDHSPVDCGTPSPNDPMWFTQAKCSIASVDFTYLDPDTGRPRFAKAGELIKVRVRLISSLAYPHGTFFVNFTTLVFMVFSRYSYILSDKTLIHSLQE